MIPQSKDGQRGNAQRPHCNTRSAQPALRLGLKLTLALDAEALC